MAPTPTQTWNIGILLLFAVIAAAFIGYVLPWGQIFWGATIIADLLSAIPYIGTDLQWMWGGFSVDKATLTRFFAFHFILPFIVAALVIVHLLLLHETGSNNPTAIISDADKIPFHPCYTIKDALGFLFLISLFPDSSLILPGPLRRPRQLHPH